MAVRPETRMQETQIVRKVFSVLLLGVIQQRKEQLALGCHKIKGINFQHRNSVGVKGTVSLLAEAPWLFEIRC